jgi:hypothetical protein
MEAKWTGIADVKDEFAYYIGVKIFENNDLLLKKYLTKKLIELNKIILGRSRSDPVKIRRIEDETAMDTRTCIEIRDRLQAFLKAE